MEDVPMVMERCWKAVGTLLERFLNVVVRCSTAVILYLNVVVRCWNAVVRKQPLIKTHTHTHFVTHNHFHDGPMKDVVLQPRNNANLTKLTNRMLPGCCRGPDKDQHATKIFR